MRPSTSRMEWDKRAMGNYFRQYSIERGDSMTAHNLTHYTLARAYARGILSAQQVAQFIALYKGLKWIIFMTTRRTAYKFMKVTY